MPRNSYVQALHPSQDIYERLSEPEIRDGRSVAAIYRALMIHWVTHPQPMFAALPWESTILHRQLTSSLRTTINLPPTLRPLLTQKLSNEGRKKSLSLLVDTLATAWLTWHPRAPLFPLPDHTTQHAYVRAYDNLYEALGDFVHCQQLGNVLRVVAVDDFRRRLDTKVRLIPESHITQYLEE